MLFFCLFFYLRNSGRVRNYDTPFHHLKLADGRFQTNRPKARGLESDGEYVLMYLLIAFLILLVPPIGLAGIVHVDYGRCMLMESWFSSTRFLCFRTADEHHLY